MFFTGLAYAFCAARLLLLVTEDNPIIIPSLDIRTELLV